MRKTAFFVLAVLVVLPAFASAQTDPKTTAPVKAKGEKPAASPGWLVIEEDVWTPLRFEPLASLDAIRYHFRRKEEKAAANQIDRSISWLKFAEEHALPITKEKLVAAQKDLATLAQDLRAGKIASAATLDSALASAAMALSEWNFYKAKESWGRNEEGDAGRDLATAARYLQSAANSAHYEFGPDTTKIITDYFDQGWYEGETTTYEHNTLGKHLQSIEKGISDLGNAMTHASK